MLKKNSKQYSIIFLKVESFVESNLMTLKQLTGNYWC